MVETGGWGGIGHYAHCLCAAMAESGIKVTLLTHATRYQLDEQPKNYRVIKIFRGDGFLSDWTRLYAALRRLHPDFVHFQSLLSTRRDWIVFLCHRYLRRRPKFVFTAHNALPHEVMAGERFAFKMLYRNASGLILHSRESAAKMSSLLNEKIPRPHAVIPHGHYGAFVKNENISRSEALELLDLEEACYIVFFGAIRPYKGLDRLFRAIAEIERWPSDVKLLVAGQPMHGVTREDVCESVRQLAIADRVVLKLDYVPERLIPAVFKVAELIALPYLEIDQSGVLMAAIAAGKPVLGTPVGALPEVVHPDIGFLSSGTAPEMLAAALRGAFEKRKLWRRMGDAASRMAEMHYSWSAIANQTLEFYRRLGSEARCRAGI